MSVPLTPDESEEEPPSLTSPQCGLQAVGDPVAEPNIPSQVGVPLELWNDWRWQMRNRLRDPHKLAASLRWFQVPDGLLAAIARFPMAITPYYASLIQRLDPTDPIFAQAVPQVAELDRPACLRDDPLEEDEDMPVPRLVHRYPDRALLIATSTCAMYCRHCTRKRVAGHRESSMSEGHLRRAVRYLWQHPEIHDVIISGGDPFTMSTEALDRILSAVRSVESVDVIRIGTRTPVTLPMRITDELVAMLRKHRPVWVNTHFNHPRELTPQAIAACAKLVDAGIPLGNQSVLLRGVNDDPQLIESLCRALIRNRVRPYYLFQCDLVHGVEHFRTPLSRGIEILEYLRGRLSGLAIPTFVVDAPHGGGKIPVLPTYIVSASPTHTVLRNYEGILVSYPEPYQSSTPPASLGAKAVGPTVSDLARGLKSSLEPAGNARKQRRRAHQPARSVARCSTRRPARPR